MTSDDINRVESIKTLQECMDQEADRIEEKYFGYDEIIQEVADKITNKNIQYGDAYSKIPQILEILAPGGITPDQYKEFPIVQRLIEKICRWFGDGVNQDLWDDIIGLGLNGRKLYDNTDDLPDYIWSIYGDEDWKALMEELNAARYAKYGEEYD